jgi:hypothetical protein
MVILPSLARAQTLSPVNTDFRLPAFASGAIFRLNYSAETNAASTLDCKLQLWDDAAGAFFDLLTSAEAGVDFVQFTGVATQVLIVAPDLGMADELATVPTLSARMPLPTKLRTVCTMAGGAGGDTITFSLSAIPLYTK